MLILRYLPVILLFSACSNIEPIHTPFDRPSQPTAKKPKIKQTANCPAWKLGQTVEITKNTRIPTHCRYQKVSFLIKTNDIIFDCQGASLNGLTKARPNALLIPYSKTNAPKAWAFHINSSGVKIKNCQIKNYIDGIIIHAPISATQRQQLRAKKQIKTVEQQLRASAAHHIVISNTKIHNSHKHGLYLKPYVHHVSFIDSEIKHSGNASIYLETGTQKNRIQGNYFYKNGYSNYKNKQRIRIPKLPTGEREAIAVDSSAYNKIINNTFENNGKGAIFLYKNCFEKHQNSKQIPRFQHSNYNLIKDNKFINERHGVWLASRQSKQLSRFKCGDKLMYTRSGLLGKEKYYQDYSQYNKVIHNTFKQVVLGIIVEDDHNQLIDNRFEGEAYTDIKIGTFFRTRATNQPVTATVLKGNQRKNSTLKLQLMHGSTE